MVVAQIRPKTRKINVEIEVPEEWIDKDLNLDLTLSQSDRGAEIYAKLKEFQLEIPVDFKFNRDECYDRDLS